VSGSGYRLGDFRHVDPRILEACVHWGDAQGADIASGFELLLRLALTECRDPVLETASTRRAFTEANWGATKRRLAEGRLSSLELTNKEGPSLVWWGARSQPGAFITLAWAAEEVIENRGSAGHLIKTYDLHTVQDKVVKALDELFADLGPAYGFINLYDHRVGLTSLPLFGTDRERALRITNPSDLALRTPAFVTDYARGVFWANFLTERHIEKLGGIERALADAPCFATRRIGPSAIVLQATRSLWELRPEALEPLERFLAPVLPRRSDVDLSPEPPRVSNLAMLEAMREPPPLPRRHVAAHSPRFPVVDHAHGGLADWPDVVFSVTLESEPQDRDLAILGQELSEWYTLGFRGAFGGRGFAWMGKLDLEGDRIVWHVDAGDAELDAYHELLQRLDGLVANGRVAIARLDVGLDEGSVTEG